MAPVQHASPLARGAIEVVPDRLYWVTCGVAPDETEDSHYFAIDNKFVYQPFAHDFGPLNLGMICRYCKLLQEKLSDPSLRDKRIIHYCSRRSFKKANAVLLICSYQVLALGRSAAKAFEPFQELSQELLPFRDASRGPSTFPLMILDCLEALQMGIEKRWLDWNKFNADSYDYFSQVDVGDMNWIIPRKFLAFASPSPTPTDAEGFPAVMPEAYAKTFLEAGIRLVCA
jgi:cell division cycle 14